MKTAAPVVDDIGSMITRTPSILGGKPCIKGHRIGVHRVAGWWKLGLTVEEIGERLSTLTPAEIHVALAYYHLHRQEIDGYLEEERAACRSRNWRNDFPPPRNQQRRIQATWTW